jgi:hypothetical protein
VMNLIPVGLPVVGIQTEDLVKSWISRGLDPDFL